LSGGVFARPVPHPLDEVRGSQWAIADDTFTRDGPAENRIVGEHFATRVPAQVTIANCLEVLSQIE